MRTKLLHTFGAPVTVARPAPTIPDPTLPAIPPPATVTGPKPDIDITIASFDDENEPCVLEVSMPAYSTDTFNHVLTLHAVYFPSPPAGQPAPIIPTDPAAILAAVGTSSGTVVGSWIDVSGILDGNGGKPVGIPVSGLLEGGYTGQLLADFDA